jgi:hypothetical protein
MTFMKSFRPARVFLSTLLGFSLTHQLQAHTVHLGTIGNQQVHSFYDQSNPGASPDVSDIRSSWAGGGAYSFADLARGTTHTFAITGMRPRFYRHVLTVAAVPDAETWLMIFIGIGLISFQLRHTQKLLQHRPLAA